MTVCARALGRSLQWRDRREGEGSGGCRSRNRCGGRRGHGFRPREWRRVRANPAPMRNRGGRTQNIAVKGIARRCRCRRRTAREGENGAASDHTLHDSSPWLTRPCLADKKANQSGGACAPIGAPFRPRCGEISATCRASVPQCRPAPRRAPASWRPLTSRLWATCAARTAAGSPRE